MPLTKAAPRRTLLLALALALVAASAAWLFLAPRAPARTPPWHAPDAAGAVASEPARASASVQPSLPDITPVAQEIERLAGDVVARKHLPGLALAIVQDGRVVSLRGYGTTDVDGGEPVTPDTVFRLASLSKAFAATLSSQLVQEEAMSWDQPIIERLPAFKLRDYQRAQQVTPRDVLAQRVGLAKLTYDNKLSTVPYPLLADQLANAPMACTTGDCYAYQNVAFSLIGDLVFSSTGDFYPHQVEARLFHPLGMVNSTFGLEGLKGSASWAKPHVATRSGFASIQPKEAYYHVPPAAGVNSTARDMAQWLIAQMGGRPDVLPPSVLNPIHTPQVATPDQLHGSKWRRARLRAAYYGMGWRVFDYAGHTLVFHGGLVEGYQGAIAFLPDQRVGIVVLWNASGSSASSGPSGLMPTFMDRVLGLPAEDWLGVEEDGTD